MATNTYNLNTYKAIFLAKEPTLTIGGTGKTFDGTADVSFSKDEILGSSDSSKFLRGDKTWANILTRADHTADIGFIVENTDTTNPLKIGYIIGGSANGGIYDYTHSAWKIQIAPNGDTTYNGYLMHGSGVKNASGASIFYFLRGNSNATENKLGAIFMNPGTTNSITRPDRMYFRHYTYNSSTGAISEAWDQYRLPEATANLATSATYDILTTKDLSFSITGNAATSSYPLGFSSRSTDATWGDQTGATITAWNEGDGGSVEFRKNNPSSGKLSIKVDGRVYFNEGATPAAGLKYANSYWGLTNPDGADNVWIRTTSNGIIPYQSGAAGSGHCSLGTDSYRFAGVYTDDIYVKTIKLNLKGTNSIYNGPNDTANDVGGALNNLVFDSWYGVSFTTNCANQTYTGTNAVSINCRSGALYAATLNATGNIFTSGAGEHYVKANNTTTSCAVYLDSAGGAHGIYSSGYWSGSAYTSSGKWMLYRGTDGTIVVNGNCTGSSGSCTGAAASLSGGLVTNTVTTHGNLAVTTAKGSYYGINLGHNTSGMTIMSQNASHQGLYNQANAHWLFYYNAASTSKSICIGSATVNLAGGISLNLNTKITGTLTVTSTATINGVNVTDQLSKIKTVKTSLTFTNGRAVYSDTAITASSRIFVTGCNDGSTGMIFSTGVPWAGNVEIHGCDYYGGTKLSWSGTKNNIKIFIDNR